MQCLIRVTCLALAVGLLGRTGFSQTVVHEVVGTSNHDFLGQDIAFAGDVNGDGFGDLVVGARGFSAGPRALLVSGRTGDTLLSLPVPWLTSVAGAGDVDGDGVPDVIVGNENAPGLGTNTGEAIVFSGATGQVLHVFTGQATRDHFGAAVAGAGDVNGDGHADLIVGAPQWSNTQPGVGYVRVFSGFDGSLLLELAGNEVGGAFGSQVAGGRDADGDGVPDIAVGASRETGVAGAGAGVVRLYSGASGALLRTFEGENAGDRFGQALDLAGDVDGDGLADLVVGSPNHGGPPQHTGKVEVFSGATGDLVHTFVGSQNATFLGISVSGAGDVDGDGFEDVIAGAAGSGGSAHVWSGRDGSLLFVFSGAPTVGRAVSTAGDVTGDGLSEVAVSDPIYSQTMPEQGRFFVLSAQPSGIVAYCFGDGSGAFCPCGNHSAAGSGQGCASSTGAGARLSAQGSVGAAADDLRLIATGLVPGAPALAFVGLDTLGGGNGVAFGDGLRCAAGGVVRLGVQFASPAGIAHYGPGLGQLGQWTPGDLRRFQAWYRDPAGSPCGTGFNLSNGIEAVFEP